jgi:uncharacterized protein YjeT (DUF2065 family)
MLLAIDPGLRMTGVSLFLDGKLHRAWLVKGLDIKKDRSYPNAWKTMAENIWKEAPGGLAHELIIEFPMVYPKREQQKGDPNDLVQLGAVAGGLVCTLNLKSTMVYPRDWKRSMPDDVTRLRIQKRLDDTEKRAIQLPTAKSYQHNVWDSIGIGLHHLGRHLF